MAQRSGALESQGEPRPLLDRQAGREIQFRTFQAGAYGEVRRARSVQRLVRGGAVEGRLHEELERSAPGLGRAADEVAVLGQHRAHRCPEPDPLGLWQVLPSRSGSGRQGAGTGSCGTVPEQHERSAAERTGGEHVQHKGSGKRSA